VAINHFLWRIGGPQGGGIDRAALLFSRLTARHGLHVLARREYHSNITGRHSYSDVRIGSQPVLSHSASPRIMLCLDAEAVSRHVHNVPAQGCIIYDKRDANTELSQLKFLDPLLMETLCDPLLQANLPCSISGQLKNAEKNGIINIAVDYDTLFRSLRDELAVSKKTAERSRNVMAVAVSAALLGLSSDSLCHEVADIFHNKADVIAINTKAVHLAYDYVASLSTRIEHPFANVNAAQYERIWINGSQSVALGKLAAGLGIQTYYPISPATDESLYLEQNSSVPLNDDTDASPAIIQTEDELAAIGMACGAALTGARAATSTSGPGFSLMVEGLGWAGMNEIPVVVNLYQRGGPSTGMPTRTEQGDLQFAIHAGHGEFPRIVLASGDIEECFYDSFRAFNYAERYQLPVIHMLDKNLASSVQTIRQFSADDLIIEHGDVLPITDSNQHVPRFRLSPNGISPRPKLGQPGQIFWSTGVEHSEIGQVSEDPVLRRRMMEKRAIKLELAAAEIPLQEKLSTFGDEQANLTVISWGSNKGAIVEAVERLNHENKPIQAIMLKLLWPFPVEELNALIPADRTVIVVECNQTGQLNQLLAQNLGRQADHLILKYTGRPFVIEDLLQSLNRIFSGTAERIMIQENAFE
jgi:2-oxoglutarate ferredoxin oxidoreductase subunit alpha